MTDPREPIGISGDWRPTSWTQADPLTVDEEPYAVCEPDRSPAVWMLGAIVAALIVAVAWLAWTR